MLRILAISLRILKKREQILQYSVRDFNILSLITEVTKGRKTSNPPKMITADDFSAVRKK